MIQLVAPTNNFSKKPSKPSAANLETLNDFSTLPKAERVQARRQANEQRLAQMRQVLLSRKVDVV